MTGASITVVGMDKPERIEGQPWDGGVLDEFANMKPGAWAENIRPALSDRKGWCDLIGVPEGRNHYYDLYEKALNGLPGWATFHWKSIEILDPQEVADARAEMDELTFQQEYEASFINFQGRAYYSFDRDLNCSPKVVYNPSLPLILCFDFNVSPGVCAIAQEHPELPTPAKNPGTAVIGEVHIPENSNTIYVCNRIKKDWSHHAGLVYCYGDATGGNPGSAKVSGSDWDIIRRELRMTFGDRLRISVPDSNPLERSRVNAVNSRLKSGPADKPIIRMMIHPEKAKNVVRDFDGVRTVEGGSGEIDKEKDKKLSHISDALGYYIHYKFPVVKSPGQKEF